MTLTLRIDLALCSATQECQSPRELCHTLYRYSFRALVNEGCRPVETFSHGMFFFLRYVASSLLTLSPPKGSLIHWMLKSCVLPYYPFDNSLKELRRSDSGKTRMKFTVASISHLFLHVSVLERDAFFFLWGFTLEHRLTVQGRETLFENGERCVGDNGDAVKVA